MITKKRNEKQKTEQNRTSERRKKITKFLKNLKYGTFVFKGFVCLFVCSGDNLKEKQKQIFNHHFAVG